LELSLNVDGSVSAAERDSACGVEYIKKVKMHPLRLVRIHGEEVTGELLAIFGVKTMPKQRIEILLGNGVPVENWLAQDHEVMEIVEYFILIAHAELRGTFDEVEEFVPGTYGVGGDVG